MLRVVILVFLVEPCRRRIERNIQLRIVNERTVVNHSSHMMEHKLESIILTMQLMMNRNI